METTNSWGIPDFETSPNESYESQSNPVLKWSIPRNMLQGLRRRISAAVYGWEYPLTSIYPGFDCGFAGAIGIGFLRVWGINRKGIPFLETMGIVYT